MLTLKHRIASGGALPGTWEFDPARGRVIATILCGSSDPIDVEILVCSEARRRHGAHLISRRYADMWIVSPVAVFLNDHNEWTTRRSAFHNGLEPDFLMLAYAPESISEELEAL